MSATPAGCALDDDDDDVAAEVEVLGRSEDALAAATLTAVNGTYGAGCVGRSGAWSVRISGSAPLANPALSVRKHNTACVLTVTSLVTDQTYTPSPAVAMTTSFQATGSAFSTGGGPLAFYANTKLSSAAFDSGFVVSILVAPDASFSTASVSAKTACAARTPVWLDGFESGVVSSAGASVTPSASLFNTVTGTVVADAAVTRSGNYALRIAKASGASHYGAKASLGTSTVVTLRLALRFSSLPSANQSELLKIMTTSGANVVLGYANAATAFTVGYGGGTAQAGPAGGLSAGRWYRIDLRVNVAASPRTVEWKVNGVDQTPATLAAAADTFAGTIHLGSTVAGDVYTAYYDDVMATASSSDYPLPDGRIESLVPNAYLGKYDPDNRLEVNGGGAVGAGSETRLDEIPMTSTSDYVGQTNIQTATYAEFGLEDVTRDGCVNAVSAVVALHSSGTNANTAKTLVRESGTERTIHNDSVTSGSSLQYRSRVVQPSSGGWSPAKVTSATMRIGYSAVNGDTPFWDALLLGYDQTARAATVYASAVATDQPASYWRLDEASGITAAAAIGSVVGTYGGSPTLDVGGAVGDTSSAVRLTGGQYVAFGDNYGFSGTSSFSFEVWIRPPAGSTAARVLSKESASGGGWMVALDSTSRLTFSRKDVLGAADAALSSALSSTRWSHVAGTYDGATLRIYVNGAVVGTGTNSTRSVPSHTASLDAGRYSGGTSSMPFSGYLDELAIYTSALSATQIEAHYNAGKR